MGETLLLSALKSVMWIPSDDNQKGKNIPLSTNKSTNATIFFS